MGGGFGHKKATSFFEVASVGKDLVAIARYVFGMQEMV